MRWCPGCGDYSILANVQKVMPELGILPENMVLVSGIGCSSRFPYYMNTYGFHTIHGRAPAVADGHQDRAPRAQRVDGHRRRRRALSIGGNHLMHCLRRNVDIKILLFNNRIYGLTKGQYSPTCELGKVDARARLCGSVGSAARSVELCARCQRHASWRARSTPRRRTCRTCCRRAARHTGSAFLEIYQNCNVFNDGAFELFREKDVRAERTRSASSTASRSCSARAMARA